MSFISAYIYRISNASFMKLVHSRQATTLNIRNTSVAADSQP